MAIASAYQLTRRRRLRRFFLSLFFACMFFHLVLLWRDQVGAPWHHTHARATFVAVQVAGSNASLKPSSFVASKTSSLKIKPLMTAKLDLKTMCICLYMCVVLYNYCQFCSWLLLGLARYSSQQNGRAMQQKPECWPVPFFATKVNAMSTIDADVEKTEQLIVSCMPY